MADIDAPSSSSNASPPADRKFFPPAPEVHIQLDSELKIVSVSESFLQTIHKTREDVMGCSIFELSFGRGLSRSQEALLQAQKLEAIGRLAGGIAHDFNNLLTGILGITEDILDSLKEGDARREDLQEVIKASNRARELTKQLLAFGRRQIGAPKLLNLNQVISDMNRLFARLLGADVLIRMGLDPKLGLVKMDQTQLEQIIVNLLINARDAIQRGGEISVETSNIELGEEYARRHAEVQPGPYVLLSIHDDGEGMDTETMRHIFEPFFTTKARGKGTGLGLATVYGIVKQNGGDIAVSSRLALGSTFRVYLPRVRDATLPVPPRLSL